MTPDQCAALQSRLDRAEQAYEDLQTGRLARVLVDQNGERVEFTPANHYRLAQYIQSLRNLLSTECGIDTPGAKVVSGPMRFIF